MQHPTSPPQPSVPGVAPPASLLLALPDELRVQIAGELSEWRDRAALCLACPPLGVASIREIAQYKDPLLAIAIALWQRSASTVLNEPLFRRYAADKLASEEGCGWLTDAAERHDVDIGFDIERRRNGTLLWSLLVGEESAYGYGIYAVGKVRLEFSNGQVRHYEGENGAERKVRTEMLSGEVKYYYGEKGAERLCAPSSRVAR